MSASGASPNTARAGRPGIGGTAFEFTIEQTRNKEDIKKLEEGMEAAANAKQI